MMHDASFHSLVVKWLCSVYDSLISAPSHSRVSGRGLRFCCSMSENYLAWTRMVNVCDPMRPVGGAVGSHFTSSVWHLQIQHMVLLDSCVKCSYSDVEGVFSIFNVLFFSLLLFCACVCDGDFFFSSRWYSFARLQEVLHHISCPHWLSTSCQWEEKSVPEVKPVFVWHSLHSLFRTCCVHTQ